MAKDTKITEEKNEVLTPGTEEKNESSAPDMQAYLEEAKRILSDAKKEAEKIIKDAKKTVVEKPNNNGFTEAELAEIKRNEEYVEVKLFKDDNKYSDDVYVAVGAQNCVIKRGVPVKIKRKFALALQQQERQDLETARLIEKTRDK